jgi:hypothetical protein
VLRIGQSYNIGTGDMRELLPPFLEDAMSQEIFKELQTGEPSKKENYVNIAKGNLKDLGTSECSVIKNMIENLLRL